MYYQRADSSFNSSQAGFEDRYAFWAVHCMSRTCFARPWEAPRSDSDGR